MLSAVCSDCAAIEDSPPPRWNWKCLERKPRLYRIQATDSFVGDSAHPIEHPDRNLDVNHLQPAGGGAALSKEAMRGIQQNMAHVG